MKNKKEHGTITKLKSIGIGTLRISRAGVPHLLYEDFSVAFFWKHRKFRVFHPYPAPNGIQTRNDFKTPNDVRSHLENNGNGFCND